MKIEALNKLLIWHIREAHIIKVNCSVNLLDNLSVWGVRNFRFFFNKFKYSGCAGKCVLKLSDNA